MSLQIDNEKVTAVMLGGVWHPIKKGTFYTDSYEFGVYYPDSHYRDGKAYDCTHGGGQSGVCATGFGFKLSTGGEVFGPLTAIQAVSYAPASNLVGLMRIANGGN